MRPSADPAVSKRWKTCCIEWCQARGQAVVPGYDPPVAACKLHSKWLAVPVPGTSIGYRKGLFVARCKLDDHLFGHMRPSMLSQTGAFEHQCNYCNAYHFDTECVRGKPGEPSDVFAKCCNHGDLRDIPYLPPAPAALAMLLTGRAYQDVQYPRHPFSLAGRCIDGKLQGIAMRQHKHFESEARRYNTAMGSASFCDNFANSDHTPHPATNFRGPPVYILKGRVYHTVGTLYPTSGNQPRYAQLYILDQADATQQRSQNFQTLKLAILRTLHDMLIEEIPSVDMWTGNLATPASLAHSPRTPLPAIFVKHAYSRHEPHARSHGQPATPRTAILWRTRQGSAHLQCFCFC